MRKDKEQTLQGRDFKPFRNTAGRDLQVVLLTLKIGHVRHHLQVMPPAHNMDKNEETELIQHKPSPRLDLSAYQGYNCFHVIFRTAHNRTVFSENWNYQKMLELL